MKTLFILLMLGLLGFALFISFESFSTNQGVNSENPEMIEKAELYEAEYGEIDENLPPSYQTGMAKLAEDIKEFFNNLFTTPQKDDSGKSLIIE